LQKKYANIKSQESSIRDFKDWQIIYSVSINYDKKASKIASILGDAESKIYQAVQQYNKLGGDWKKDKKWGGRREERSIMTLEKEKIKSITAFSWIKKALKGI